MTVGRRPFTTGDTSFLEGGGELGALIRARDWTRTPLGSPMGWPRSLKTAVRIMLTSRQPIWIGWGPELTYLYNDPYKSIIGGKHPKALGRPFHEVWHEIWDVVGPMADHVMNRDEGTYVEAQLLVMERHGYQEETYYTFSYSPIPNDDGGPGGLICANTDDTRRVIGERQVAALRELAARTADARTVGDACERAVEALATDPHDVPFALVFASVDSAEPRLLAATQGTDGLGDASRWRIDEALREGRIRVLSLENVAAAPTGAWSRPPSQVAVVPLSASGQAGTRGAIAIGLSPFRSFDESYQGFLDLVGKQVSAGIANAKAYEQERRRAEALAQLDQAKTEFFSNVSHEFRTPLTLMLGPLEDSLARSQHLPPEDRERLEVTHRNALRLLKLVNTLLDFSRIEAGRIEASFEPTELGSFTSELASHFRSALERAGLALVVEHDGLDEPVWVDRSMWEKIVFNLLSNAYKFTFEGEIAVVVGRRGDHAVLTVRDTGTGIPPEELPRLFERFHRVRGARGRTFEGSGIGLSLVQELARLHGGTVSVESEVGRGSAFAVSVPLGNQHLPADRLGASHTLATTELPRGAYIEELASWSTAPRLPGEDRRSSPGTVVGPTGAPRILLADDNADMRDYVQRLLGDRYEVEAVGDGARALAAARARRPDLIVTDVMMPELDGFGLLRELRADESLAGVPVIMLSARAGEEARVEGVAAGADDYLAKPFSARELLARVAARLEMSRLHRKLDEERAALRESDRKKDEFLATLSHELRNPLAPLRNGVQILRMGGDGSSTERVVDSMERQVDHLVRLVDDLLELSRINRGSFELRREAVEIGEVVRRAVESVEPLLRTARHRVSIELPERTLWVDGDAVRLEQVLGNILSNAIKYTPPGGNIWVRASIDGLDALVAVRDDGAGIRPQTLPHIFEMFSRGDQVAGSGPGGLGIGLALARRLAEMHGGSLDATSEGLGRGSEVVLRIPLRAQQRGEPKALPGAQPHVPSRRILVVDDNTDASDTMAMLLSALGAQVRVAHDGECALAEMKSWDPEVVLLDIGMPGMDGYEVARRIRADFADRRTLLIALTGWGQESDRRRAREAGFDHHLTKPADLEVLRSLLITAPTDARLR